MAALGAIGVPCPECGEKVEVSVVSSTEIIGDALQVRLSPDVSKMAEHYAQEHCGQDVSDA